MKTVRVFMTIIAAMLAVLGIMRLLQPSTASAAFSASAGDVVINEIAWGGTAASSSDEWIELKNNTGSVVDLTGWSLRADDGTPNITLSGSIAANGYFLLERTDDNAVSDIPADQIYTGASSNSGETLRLVDTLSNTIDSVNADGGGWSAGSGLPNYDSMERIDALSGGDDANWASNDGVTRNGLDADSNPLNGTPAQENSVAGSPPQLSEVGSVLVSAVHFNAYDNGDEGFRLTNVSTATITLTNWIATDGEQTLELTGTLASGQSIWLAKRAVTFTQQFGFKPDYEYDADSDPLVPNLAGSVPLLSDNDELAIREGGSNWVDAVVWGTGQITDTGWPDGWIGSNVQRYTTPSIGGSAQIIYRKLDEASGAFVADTDTALDWTNDSTDEIAGRKLMYPGWDIDLLWQTAKVVGSARLTVAIAPDNAFMALDELLRSARQSIKVQVHSFENLGLLQALTETIQTHGVSVTVLLEGGPVGGIDDQELWICQKLKAAGGACWFMISDSAADIYDRYRYLHAKMIIVDDLVVAIGSENFSPRSMPYDDKSDGTLGQRGVYLITDAPGVVARALQIWNVDFDPANHRDITPWSSGDPTYGDPPLGFTPAYTTGGSGYTIRYPTPLSLTAPFTFELLTSPESSLRQSDAVLGWITQAASGDTIFVEHLDQPPHWGASSSNATDDPNVMLEALIAAASRGAQVHILLDSYYDDAESSTSNAATRIYIDSLRATSATLMSNLEARRGNPTLGGIHNKMYLFDIAGHKVVHVGSINGSELSNKGNREIALQVESEAAYDYLRAMFEYDWAFQSRLYMPFVTQNYEPPSDHLLVSKVYYLGQAYVGEWVQIYNPTGLTVTLSSYKIGDEETKNDTGFGFDGMWSFPPAATIAPGQKVNIAATLAGFYDRFGYDPDYSLFDGTPGVNKMAPYLAWTNVITFSLANSGDEVLLLGPDDELIDGVAWGTGSLPGNTSCPAAVPPPYVSLERTPIGNDSDSCPADFVLNESPLP